MFSKDALRPLLHLTPQRNACGRPHHQRSQAASLPIRNSPHHDVRIGDLGSTINGYGLDCTERKQLRRLLGYFWPRVCHNEDLYAELDVIYRRMTCGKHQHLAPPSKVAKINRLRFFGHILRRLADRLVQRVLRSSSGSSWKKPPGRKRKFWTEVVKEELRTFGVYRQFRRDVRFPRIWNSDEWIDSVQALAEDREGWAELCSRTAHLGEDAGNRVRR
ncbi:hypothetical protein RB195_002048 [Necator americanus]|uniref:Uncharacterized protein n=1 Tax=Necator americanus TaxID=51031 RepID=A0ABR1DIK6_NECAM